MERHDAGVGESEQRRHRVEPVPFTAAGREALAAAPPSWRAEHAALEALAPDADGGRAFLAALTPA